MSDNYYDPGDGPLRDDIDKPTKKLAEHDAEIKRLRAEVERERMRLAACGVIAIADTPESARQSRTMHADYESASCDAVARRVDECIAMRAEIERLREENSTFSDSLAAKADRIDRLGETAARQVAEIERLRNLFIEQAAKNEAALIGKDEEIERLREAVKFLNSFRPDAELAKRDAEIERLRKEKDKAYDNGFIVGTQKAPTYKENQELRDEIERLRKELIEKDDYIRTLSRPIGAHSYE